MFVTANVSDGPNTAKSHPYLIHRVSLGQASSGLLTNHQTHPSQAHAKAKTTAKRHQAKAKARAMEAPPHPLRSPQPFQPLPMASTARGWLARAQIQPLAPLGGQEATLQSCSTASWPLASASWQAHGGNGGGR